MSHEYGLLACGDPPPSQMLRCRPSSGQLLYAMMRSCKLTLVLSFTCSKTYFVDRGMSFFNSPYRWPVLNCQRSPDLNPTSRLCHSLNPFFDLPVSHWANGLLHWIHGCTSPCCCLLCRRCCLFEMASDTFLLLLIQLLHTLWACIIQFTPLNPGHNTSRHNFSELPIVAPPPPSPADTLRRTTTNTGIADHRHSQGK